MQSCYIAGSWSVPAGSEEAENRNPSDLSDLVGSYTRAPASAVDDAVSAARDAQPGWAQSSPQTRADLLETVAAAILGDVPRLAELLAREEGKTRREATAEVTRAGQVFRFFAGEALRMVGEDQDSTRPGVSVRTGREPVGVIGVITPWNFPIAIPSWKVAPALAFGNTVVMKPADLVTASALELARILDAVGFPPGVFNLVTGRGSVVGEAILNHEGIDAITFTGSQSVGRRVAERAVSRLADVQLEMGGKNPLLVLADADMEVAVQVAIDGAFYATGQRCTASSRLIVEESVADEFVDRMLARMATLKVGHALEEGSDIGPVVDADQLEIDLGYIAGARAEEGVEVLGGEELERPTRGFYLSPALVLGSDESHRINREEVFGPVAAVLRASDYEHALAMANDTPFGLSAGICTTSLYHAEDFRRRADAGMVMVNLPTAGVDPHVRFGGRKSSSYGPSEQGSYAREFFTRTKTAYVRP